MSSRELVVLGTASQVPTRHRNHNGYFLRWDGRGILFDPGEGTQRQMVRCGVSATQITAICVSHFHGDHCLGLAGIIQRLSLDGVPHEVPIFYPASGEAYFERLRHASIFKDQAKIRPVPLSDEGVVYEDAEVTLSARRLSHTVESWGYRLQERDSVRMNPSLLDERGIVGPAIGALMRAGEAVVEGAVVRLSDVSDPRPGQSAAFVMDTRRCAAAVALAQGVDLLIAESTYLATEQKEAVERGHMTAQDAATIAREAGARQLVLAHFSQRYPKTREFEEEARQIHPQVVAAQDGAVVAVPKRRSLG